MSQISALIAANSLPQLAVPLIDAAAQQGGNAANVGNSQSPSALRKPFDLPSALRDAAITDHSLRDDWHVARGNMQEIKSQKIRLGSATAETRSSPTLGRAWKRVCRPKRDFCFKCRSKLV